MDAQVEILNRVLDQLLAEATTVKRRRALGPRIRRAREPETGKPRRFTTRPYIKVSPAVYDQIADGADQRSLDMSRLALLSGLGKIRIRPSPVAGSVGRLNKTFRMTISDSHAAAIAKTMREQKSEYPSLMAFAVATAQGLVTVNPAAPVMLTLDEEWSLQLLDEVRRLAARCDPPPAIQPQLDDIYESVRRRLETHGLQPGDPKKLELVRRLRSSLVDELMTMIYPEAFDGLWRQLAAAMAEIGRE